MIKAVFYRSNGSLCGFDVSGHAGYAEKGNDIVCAAVSSAVMMTVNAITDILNVECDLKVLDDEIKLMFDDECFYCACSFLEALKLHLNMLSEDYSEFIQLDFLEV